MQTPCQKEINCDIVTLVGVAGALLQILGIVVAIWEPQINLFTALFKF
jgi:hypothetical protein